MVGFSGMGGTLIIDVLGTHKTLADKLVPFKDGAIHKYPVIRVNTETLDALCVIYSHTPSANIAFAWNTVHSHLDGKMEFVFCKKPDRTKLDELTRVEHTAANGSNVVLYCQEMQLDYIAYFPDHTSLIPYEIIEALRSQKVIKPVRLSY